MQNHPEVPTAYVPLDAEVTVRPHIGRGPECNNIRRFPLTDLSAGTDFSVSGASVTINVADTYGFADGTQRLCEKGDVVAVASAPFRIA
jgi:hypothetical protein